MTSLPMTFLLDSFFLNRLFVWAGHQNSWSQIAGAGHNSGTDYKRIPRAFRAESQQRWCVTSRHDAVSETNIVFCSRFRRVFGDSSFVATSRSAQHACERQLHAADCSLRAHRQQVCCSKRSSAHDRSQGCRPAAFPHSTIARHSVQATSGNKKELQRKIAIGFHLANAMIKISDNGCVSLQEHLCADCYHSSWQCFHVCVQLSIFADRAPVFG